MIDLSRAALAAVLSLALSPAVASAAAPAADAGRAPVSAHILVRDLDLASAAGRQLFAVRVHAAARRACGSERSLHAQRDSHRCRGEMERDAALRLAALTPRRAIELAAATPR